MLLTSILITCTVFGLGLATDRVVQTELEESVVQELLKCINLLSTDYKIYVGVDRHVVVIPVGRRAIDLAGIDKGLAKCMLQVLGEMTVIAESSEFEDPAHQSALATGSADFAFLLANGAKGQRTQPGFDADTDIIVNATCGRPKDVQVTTARTSIFTHNYCGNDDYVT